MEQTPSYYQLNRGRILAKYAEKKADTSAPRDAEGVKGQTNIPFCIEFHALSNGHVRFIVATNPNFNMTPLPDPKI